MACRQAIANLKLNFWASKHLTQSQITRILGLNTNEYLESYEQEKYTSLQRKQRVGTGGNRYLSSRRMVLGARAQTSSR